jgi:drug/metabolite transporter (DMT)-like permease
MISSRAQYSDSFKGILAMIVAALLLTLNDATTKWLTETYPVWQVLALRQFCSLLLIVPYIYFVTGWGVVKVTNRPGMALRSLFFVATTGTIVVSFSLLPLALVTAIAFSSPLFVVAFSHLFTDEKVGPRRWLAVLVGFAGVLVIVRPGEAGFEMVLILPVLAALFAGSRDILTRGLSRTESSISILLWSNLAVIAVALAVTTVQGWQGVTGTAALLLLFNGALNAVAHFLIIEALRLGEASLVSPFRYSGLIWAIMLGLVIWGDFPDSWTLAGAVLLVASGVYIIERSPRTAKLGGRP